MDGKRDNITNYEIKTLYNNCIWITIFNKEKNIFLWDDITNFRNNNYILSNKEKKDIENTTLKLIMNKDLFNIFLN